MVDPVTIVAASFAGANAVKVVARDLFDIVKRRHQRDLNDVEWMKVEKDCKNMKELLDIITTEPERINEEPDKTLFKSNLSSAQSRFEDATNLLSEMRGVELESSEENKDIQIPTENGGLMDNVDTYAESARELKNDEEKKEKHQPSTVNIHCNQQSEDLNMPVTEVGVDESNQEQDHLPSNTSTCQENDDVSDESDMCGQVWYCCGLGNIFQKHNKTTQSNIPSGPAEKEMGHAAQHVNGKGNISSSSTQNEKTQKNHENEENQKKHKKQQLQKDKQKEQNEKTQKEQTSATNRGHKMRVDRDRESLGKISTMIREGCENLHKAAEIANKYEAFKPYFATPLLPSNCHLDFKIPRNSEEEISHEGMLKKELMKCMKDSNDIENTGSSRTKKKVWSIGVWGNGGMGKSVALQSLCREEDIRAHFTDGIYFLDLGENASTIDLIYQLGSCIGNAGYKKARDEVDKLASQSNQNALNDAAQRCKRVFDGRRILVVVDDVWEKGGKQKSVVRVVEEVMSDSNGGGIVFSTRERKMAVDKGTRQVHFDYLKATGDTARAILKSHLDGGENMDVLQNVSEEAKDSIDRVLKMCGGLKLCLAIAGSGIREKLHETNRRDERNNELTSARSNTNITDIIDEQKRNNLNRTLIAYAYNLEETKSALSCEEKAPDYVNLVAVAESSLKACRHWASTSGLKALCEGDMGIEEMFYALCTVERQQAMPYCEVVRLWKDEGIEDRHCKRVLNQFESLNLVSLSKKEEVRLHDRMIDVCIDRARAKMGSGGVEKWHKKLLNSYIERGEESWSSAEESNDESNEEMNERRCRDWWDMKKVKGEYIVGHLGRHMVEGGMLEELMWLVSDLRWTMRRREEGGWGGLNGDFERVLGGFIGNDSDEEDKRGIRMLHEALRSSWNEIRENEHVIGFEIYGRIPEEARNKRVVSWYLRSVDKFCKRPWLRPRWAFLQKTDGREISQVKAPGEVSAVYWSVNEQIKATGYEGSRLFVQDISTLQTSYIEIDDRMCMDYCNTNNIVVVGLKSGEVQVWDVESGEMIGNAMYGHEDWVKCVSFSMDGKRVVSGSARSVGDWNVVVWDIVSNRQVTGKLVSPKLRIYERLVQEILHHKSLSDSNSLASNHLCMQAIHREILGTIEQMGWSTSSLILDECNEGCCCLEGEFRVDSNKPELLVSDKDVRVQIGENLVKLASIDRASTSATGNLAAAHGFEDGRVVISELQE